MFVTRRSHGVPSVIAHRGASGAEPENTVAAFHRAVSMGADMVELDVRRSADGALVVHHDPYLPDGRAISRTAAAALPRQVPTLTQALVACAPLAVNIEIKNDPDEPGFDPERTLADDVAALVRARRQVDQVVVSSFDRPTLDRLRAAPGPPIATAWLVSTVPGGVVAASLAGGYQALHPEWRSVDGALVEQCHRAGLAVNVWTCDDPEAMTELAAWGVDGICTNVPDVARAVLRR